MRKTSIRGHCLSVVLILLFSVWSSYGVFGHAGGRYVFNGVPPGRFAARVLPLGTALEEQVQEAQVGGMSVEAAYRV
jgi:hypothetical protein